MATGATEFIDATTADVFFPEIWSRFLIRAREQQLVFADRVDRRYEKEVSFGDRVHAGSVTNLAARTKDRSSNAAVTFETQTETNTTLTISTWEYAAFALETATKKQSFVDLVKEYNPKMAYALALAVDDVLAGHPDDFTSNTAVGTLSQDLSYEDILTGMQYLDDSLVPPTDRSLLVSPKQAMGFMRLQHFINNDLSKLQGKTMKTAADRAYVQSILGVEIYKSTNIEGTNASGHDNALFHREAIALVMQLRPQSHYQFDINYLAHKYASEQLYGSAIMRNDHGVFMRGA